MGCEATILPGIIYVHVSRYDDVARFNFNLYKINISAYGFLHYGALIFYTDHNDAVCDTARYMTENVYSDSRLIT